MESQTYEGITSAFCEQHYKDEWKCVLMNREATGTKDTHTVLADRVNIDNSEVKLGSAVTIQMDEDVFLGEGLTCTHEERGMHGRVLDCSE